MRNNSEVEIMPASRIESSRSRGVMWRIIHLARHCARGPAQCADTYNLQKLTMAQ